MGFAASQQGLAILARASQKQVVNVAQHGGLCAVMISHTAPAIGEVTAEHPAAGRSAEGNLHTPLTEFSARSP
jgi:hypothetical protein